MNNIRIGKDITVEWKIKTNGESLSLEGRDLSLFVHDADGHCVQLQHRVKNNNVVVGVFRGVDQKHLGVYTCTLWDNLGRHGQTVVDSTSGFRLVKNTSLEEGTSDSGIEAEGVVSLGEDNMVLGVKGEDGKSAYEIAVDNGFVGTEEEWLASLHGEPGTTDFNELDNNPFKNGTGATTTDKKLTLKVGGFTDVVDTSNGNSIPNIKYVGDKVREYDKSNVKTSGEQIISGIKAFANAIMLDDGGVVSKIDDNDPNAIVNKGYVDDITHSKDEELSKKVTNIDLTSVQVGSELPHYSSECQFNLGGYPAHTEPISHGGFVYTVACAYHDTETDKGNWYYVFVAYSCVAIYDSTHVPQWIKDALWEYGRDRVDYIEQALEEAMPVLAGKVDEAPQDGKVYGRKDGEWVESVDETLERKVDDIAENVEGLDAVVNGKTPTWRELMSCLSVSFNNGSGFVDCGMFEATASFGRELVIGTRGVNAITLAHIAYPESLDEKVSSIRMRYANEIRGTITEVRMVYDEYSEDVPTDKPLPYSWDAATGDSLDLTLRLNYGGGLVGKVEGKQDSIEDLDDIRSGAQAGAKALQDAPIDGKQYARQNGTWAEVQGGGGTGGMNTDLSNIDDEGKQRVNDIVSEGEVGQKVASNSTSIAFIRQHTDAIDFKRLPLLCGQPMKLFGAGTPQEAIVPDNWKQYDPATGEGYQWNGLPSALGQEYINTSATTNGHYTAVPNGFGNLKWANF